MRNIIPMMRRPRCVPKFPLNQVSGSVAAYGLSKLNSTATKAIRVRRASDNVELDIGFYGSRPTVRLSNLLDVRGNFGVDSNADGLADGWENYLISSRTLVNNVQSIVTSGAAYAGIYCSFDLPSLTDRLYVCAYLKGTLATVRVRLNPTNEATVVASPNTRGFVSVLQASDSTTIGRKVYFENTTAAVATIDIEQVHVINTAIIAQQIGSIPTKAQLDAVVKNLIDTQGYVTEKDIINVWQSVPKRVNSVPKYRIYNALSNGDFKFGTLGWTSVASVITLLNGKIRMRGDGTSTWVMIKARTTNIPYTKDRKIYTRAIVSTTVNATGLLHMSYNEADTTTSYAYGGPFSPVLNTPLLSSGIETLPVSASDNYTFSLGGLFASSAVAAGADVEVSEIVAIDMGIDATNPLYNKTQAEMDELVTKSIAAYGFVSGEIIDGSSLISNIPKSRVYNSLVNGNFKFGTTGWKYSVGQSKISSVKNSLISESLVDNQSASVGQTTGIIASATKKVFVKFTVTNIGDVAIPSIQTFLDTPGGTEYYGAITPVDNPTKNVPVTKYFILNGTANTVGALTIWTYCSGTIGRKYKLENYIVVDMGSDTSNPLYNKTSAEMNTLVGNYIEAYGFAEGEIDGEALLTFCGSSSGYVSKWYDQSGKGNDAAQATAANQPRVVNSGVIDDGIYFDGTDDVLTMAQRLPIGITTFATEANFINNSLTSKFIIGSDIGGWGYRLDFTSGKIGLSAVSVAAIVNSNTAVVLNKYAKYAAVYNPSTGDYALFFNGGSDVSGTNKQTLVSTPNYIGAATGNSSNFKGFLKTVIVFNKILNQLQVAKL